jgi:hypothetical protein
MHIEPVLAKGQSVLLICPLFFSYHENISKELSRRGYEVTWWDDRASASSWYKLLLRVFPAVMAHLSDGYFFRQTKTLQHPDRFAHVLVVKGESLSQKSVRRLRNCLPGARFSYYTWDGIENARSAKRLASLFDAVATFDPIDAEQQHWTFRPLFSRNSEQVTGDVPVARYDWAFIGSLHSDRFLVLRRLVTHNPSQRAYAFLFIPGTLTWWLRHLVDWNLWKPTQGIRLSLQSMTAAEASDVLIRSHAVVDIEHPRQRGLTMRTIETLLAGQKLITTNSHIRNSDLYHPSRICVIDRSNPVIPEDFLLSPFAPISETTSFRYSLEGWIDDLIGKV